MSTARMATIDITEHEGLLHRYVKAARWAAAAQHRGAIDVDDLLQAGRLGMLRAAETFDPERGAWSTYAIGWIRHYVSREYANLAVTIGTPIHEQERRRRAGEHARPLVYSLHTPVQDDVSTTHLECLTYPEPESDADDLPDAMRGVTLEGLIAEAALDERQAWILRERAKGRTLRQIGDELGLSREWIRQLEALAFDAVRAANGITPKPPKPPKPKPPKRDAAAERKRRARHLARLEVLACGELSERERHVLAARAQGRRVRDVARELGVSCQRVSEIEGLALARRRAAA